MEVPHPSLKGTCATCWENAPPHTPGPSPRPLILESLISWQRGCRTSTDTKGLLPRVAAPPLSHLPPQLQLPIPPSHLHPPSRHRDFLDLLVSPPAKQPKISTHLPGRGRKGGKSAALSWEGPWVGRRKENPLGEAGLGGDFPRRCFPLEDVRQRFTLIFTFFNLERELRQQDCLCKGLV